MFANLQIVDDQTLRERGEGETTLTNPNLFVRRRFRKLYEDYKPQFSYWKLVLMMRKVCLACVAILLSKNAHMQVRALPNRRLVNAWFVRETVPLERMSPCRSTLNHAAGRICRGR